MNVYIVTAGRIITQNLDYQQPIVLLRANEGLFGKIKKKHFILKEQGKSSKSLIDLVNETGNVGKYFNRRRKENDSKLRFYLYFFSAGNCLPLGNL